MAVFAEGEGVQGLGREGFGGVCGSQAEYIGPDLGPKNFEAVTGLAPAAATSSFSLRAFRVLASSPFMQNTSQWSNASHVFSLRSWSTLSGAVARFPGSKSWEPGS